MPVRILLSLLFLLAAVSLKAQPPMPDMIGTTDNGVNVLAWTSQYDGIKSIAMQRSQDSLRNFATIGYVKDLKKGPQAFIDGHPNPGKNWYRLYIVFASDLAWYSNTYKLFVDSASLLKQKILPSNDSLQKYASKVKTLGDSASTGGAAKTTAVAAHTNANGTVTVAGGNVKPSAPVIAIPNLNTANSDAAMYIKSQYIFTNPFTGHVNVEIPDVRAHVFSIKFFDQKTNKVILEVPRINESPVILDKRNFQRKGIYKFQLDKDRQQLETGYITIY
jgi:hypothetical protein